ncbi:hypothetical protein PCANC_07568 [Puccinia coronata f. sp. avenae]|uniref:Uncharacterized protein n=1 Tax=Puccinia coronata f. sp. avenae TaxID=200324 RepID=A0A2N5U8G6_9BASI|nr:hypothetical protein PCASD_22794 [Puccinia coronata f. sp. avenae]PLW15499.1 hypothetical protein PCANC_15688 [Puccinia coronata f. sp. avenae]PLW34042.1 hypothetical protein PCASD_14481 [Puccinia coronata f. sp. avenae]PLW52997.1 hypothetical protein PCANC_07568 [Puccinia coronata f. sp. avenae]
MPAEILALQKLHFSPDSLMMLEDPDGLYGHLFVSIPTSDEMELKDMEILLNF